MSPAENKPSIRKTRSLLKEAVGIHSRPLLSFQQKTPFPEFPETVFFGFVFPVVPAVSYAMAAVMMDMV